MRKQLLIFIGFTLLQQSMLYSQRKTEDSLLNIVALSNKDDNEMKAF